MTLKADVQEATKMLKAVARKIEKIQRQVDKLEKPKAPKRKATAKKAPAKKAAAKKAPVKKVAPKGSDTAVATALAIINRSKKGVNTATLMAKTGFTSKKVHNLFYKLKKQGKIKNAGKGVYVKA